LLSARTPLIFDLPSVSDVSRIANVVNRLSFRRFLRAADTQHAFIARLSGRAFFVRPLSVRSRLEAVTPRADCVFSSCTPPGARWCLRACLKPLEEFLFGIKIRATDASEWRADAFCSPLLQSARRTIDLFCKLFFGEISG
jgi:hypothetical protein